MPGVPDKKNTQVALVEGSGDADPIAQPRQPQNLQGLLRFAMEAQEAGGSHSNYQAPQPLDEERKQFLEEALKSMSVDVVALMKEQIAILRDCKNVPDDDLDDKLAAFETILEYVTNVDVANDFHKINGFSIFDSCLASNQSEIRASACDLIAELSQNNTYIQNVVCDCTNLFQTLLKLMENDENTQVVIKALYAVSCLTRESEIGYKNFRKHNGLLIMRNVFVRKEDDKIRTKVSFLLSSLQRLDPELLKHMMEMGFLPVLLGALKGEWKSSHEHISSLLHLIATSSDTNCAEMKNEKYEVKNIIEEHLRIILGKPEYKEEEFYCKEILKAIS